MESAIVIKVKYGDTLRRFNAQIAENGELALDRDALRAKIFVLFDFPTDADIIITYIDEDGDVVTLIDDEDLRYVMELQLKYLRFDVHLCNKKSGKGPAWSIGNSTPERPTRFPDPLDENLHKLSLAISSRAVSSEAVSSNAGVKQDILPAWNSASRTSQEASAENVSGVVGAPIPPLRVSIPKLDHRDPKPFECPSLPVAFNGEGTNNQDDLSWSKNFRSTHSYLSQLGLTAGFGASSWLNESASYLQFPFNAQCPYSGMPLVDNSAAPPATRLHMTNSNNHNNGISGVALHEVRCVGCGAYPIVGSRYNYKTKGDHDLCGVCFSDIINKTDYRKIDRPISSGYSFRYNPSSYWNTGGFSLNTTQHKFDSSFILDVNVPDDTLMPPSTPFTKMWRMRNSGSYAWLPGTQLVFMGGDRLSCTNVAKIKIPPYGVAVDGELDIAVDFVSPKLPGRYISYWRMSTSSGVPFGQRIWALIQVDASLKDSLSGNFQGLSLKSLPDVSKCAEMLDVNVDPVLELCNTTAGTEPEEPVVLEKPTNQESNLAPKDCTPEISALQPPSFFPFPVKDLSAPAHFGSSHSIPAINAPTSSEGPSAKESADEQQISFIEKLLDKPEDLNKEIVRLNEFNMDRLNDIYGEWDILEELQEMGFSDQEMNKKLLKKNKGSIQGVVMDILAGTKA